MLTDPQYERIARYLDGEAVELSAEELSAAREVRAGEEQVGALLQDPCPDRLRQQRLQRVVRRAVLGDVQRDEETIAPLLDAHVSSLRIERVVRRAMLGDVQADQAVLGPMLDVKLPPRRIDRIGRRAMLVEVRADEAAIAGLLDVAVPRGTLERAHRRLAAELMRPRRRLMRLAGGAAAAALAAVALLAVMLQSEGPGPAGPGPGPTQIAVVQPPPELVPAAPGAAEDAAIDKLAAEVEDMEVDMRTPPACVSMDLRIEKLQNEVRDLWLELPSSVGDPPGAP
jgi:hypothetical protein